MRLACEPPYRARSPKKMTTAFLHRKPRTRASAQAAAPTGKRDRDRARLAGRTARGREWRPGRAFPKHGPPEGQAQHGRRSDRKEHGHKDETNAASADWSCGNEHSYCGKRKHQGQGGFLGWRSFRERQANAKHGRDRTFQDGGEGLRSSSWRGHGERHRNGKRLMPWR